MTGIDITIVNVALPSIGASLHAPVSSLQWTIDSYTLVIACLLVLSGSLADRYGRKRMFQTGLLLFGLSSLLCGLAPGVGWLIGFRALQAVGGSMLNPVAMSIIVSVFTDRRERARAVGVWGSVIGITVAAGPVLGGVLVSAAGWRSVFWVNVPVCIAAIVLTQRYVPESRASRARAFDPPGQGLVIVMFASVIAATIEGPGQGWGSLPIVGLFVLAALALAGLLALEPRRQEPLIDLRFFRSAPFSGANAIALAVSASLGGFLFLNTLYLQDVRHYSALRAGLMIIPLAAGQGVLANVSGRLVASRGARLPLVLGGAPLAAGALASTGRQFGISIGVAVTGSIVTSTGPHFITASHAAWAVLGGCGLLALLLGLVTTGRWAQGTATRNGERLAAETQTQPPRTQSPAEPRR